MSGIICKTRSREKRQCEPEEGKRKQLEVDFVCNLGNKRYYIQSALNLDTKEKTIQESRSLNNIGDSFKK